MCAPASYDWRGLRCPLVLVQLKMALSAHEGWAQLDDMASVADLCRYLRRRRIGFVVSTVDGYWWLSWHGAANPSLQEKRF
ncbi:MAG: hypothetical protein II007_02110 [Gammaproteobacteria bacterium]|nr:hypothetical protein [Gammaproteobacteria bacterium]